MIMYGSLLSITSCLLSSRVCFFFLFFFVLTIRRPPRSTPDRSSAASDVYKRQGQHRINLRPVSADTIGIALDEKTTRAEVETPVSYTHLRAQETVLDLACSLLLEKKTTCIKNKIHPV